MTFPVLSNFSSVEEEQREARTGFIPGCHWSVEIEQHIKYIQLSISDVAHLSFGKPPRHVLARAHTHTHTHTHTCSHTTQFPPCCVYLPLSFYLKAQVSPNSSCHFLFHLQLFFATWPVCYLGHDVFFAYLFFLTTLWYLSSRITGNFNSFAHWRVP